MLQIKPEIIDTVEPQLSEPIGDIQLGRITIYFPLVL